MGLSAQNVQERFLRTGGSDPLFAAVDGANCPGNNSRQAAAHSLLLKNGLIRVGITLPAGAQFAIKAVVDPYGCAISTDTTGAQTVSVYRRPLPTTNLRFLSAVMFDGRETIAPLNKDDGSFEPNLVTDLMHQAMDATNIHAQAAVPLTSAQQQEIVNFEMGLYSAQVFDYQAGPLNQSGAGGGPVNLSATNYYPGVNDTLGADPTGAKFNPNGMTLFASWANSQAEDYRERDLAARRDIAAGEALFDSRPLTITNVRGLNDNAALATALGVTLPIPAITGTCTTCHDTPNVGDHSLPLPLDIGTGHDAAQEPDTQIANGLAQLSLPGVPVYEITGCPDPFAAAGAASAPYVIYTTDPGKGLLTGQCADVNRIKGPILRGLAARAPYFHNGAAKDLNEVLNFYNQRFQMDLTDTEKRQLIAFLNAL